MEKDKHIVLEDKAAARLLVRGILEMATAIRFKGKPESEVADSIAATVWNIVAKEKP